MFEIEKTLDFLMLEWDLFHYNIYFLKLSNRGLWMTKLLLLLFFLFIIFLKTWLQPTEEIQGREKESEERERQLVPNFVCVMLACQERGRERIEEEKPYYVKNTFSSMR